MSDAFAQTSTCKHAHAVFCLAACKHFQIHMAQEQMALNHNDEEEMQMYLASLSCAKSCWVLAQSVELNKIS